MFTIQYKVSTNLRNPNSNTGIRKPWTEKPNTMDRKTAYHNTAKNGPNFFFRGLHPQTPRSALRITVFELTLGKPTGGALAGYPPVTPLRRARRRRIARGASRARAQTPCKEYNINPTFSHLLFSLHTGRTNFQINNPGQKCPLLLYTKRTSQCSQILLMNLQHFPKCQLFPATPSCFPPYL